MEDHQKRALAEHGMVQLPEINESYLNSLERQCLAYSGLKGIACWTEMGELYTKLHNYNNPRAVFEACRAAPEEAERDECYLKAVIVTAVYDSYETRERLLSICHPYQDLPQKYQRCVLYAISAFMNYSPTYTQRGTVLCSSIPHEFSQNCFQALVTQLRILVPLLEKRVEFCKDVPDEFREQCARP